jgi:hypothetical protein
VKSTNLLIFSSYYRNRTALSCTSGITEACSFTRRGLSLTRSPLSIIYRIGDKLHSVRVGRRYKEVLENGREMCVFFATLAGTGPFSFALDLISISFAAEGHFTGSGYRWINSSFIFGADYRRPGRGLAESLYARNLYGILGKIPRLEWVFPLISSAKLDLRSLSSGSTHPSSHVFAAA